MKSKSLINHKLAAMSLVEVLAVLGLVAVFIVGAAQMTVRLLINVKNNEVIDYVSGVQVQALEIAKSPAEVAVTRTLGQIPPGYLGSYRLRYGTPNVLLYQSGATSLITDCADTSAYRITTSTAEAASLPTVCLQFVIQPQTSLGNNTYYQITTRLIYNLNGQDYINDLVGYRSQDFEEVGQSRN